MKKDAMITIVGEQRVDGDDDRVELVTAGSFCRRKDSYYILYNESEATGFAGSKTMVKYERDRRRVTITRTGTTRSEIVIEQGERHQSSYDMGFGGLTIGVSCNHMVEELTDDGGELEFAYSLDMNSTLTSEHRVIMQVRTESEAPQA